MRILFLSRWFPDPPDNGSKLRVYHLLRGLAKAHEVTLLSFRDQPEIEPESASLGSICGEVQTVYRKPFQPRSARAIAGFFALRPRSVIDTHSPAMEQRIRQLLDRRRFDLVIASQEGTAAYARAFGGLPALFEEVEIGVLYERYAHATTLPSRFRNYLTWVKQKRFLASQLSRFKACTVVSERERSLLDAAVPGLPVLEVVPNCVNLSDYADSAEELVPNRLVFTGSFTYPPNHEAMAWFLGQVYPGLQREIPGVHLVITGDHANLRLPPAEGVTYTGWVQDVRPLVAASWVSLAPIHHGGGTRLKILEAMALGTPVVATAKGAEGLEVESGRHLLIADSPSDFGEAVTRILRDWKLRSRLASGARELLAAKYDWAAVMPRFLALAERAALM